MTRNELIAAIQALPDELQELAGGVPEDTLRRRPSPGEWSILEVGCHLRDSVEIEQGRIGRMASEDNPLLEPYDQEALAIQRNYQGEDPQRVLEALRASLIELAGTLKQLPDDVWERPGRHGELGRVTVDARAQPIPLHAREHFEQIRAIRERIR